MSKLVYSVIVLLILLFVPASSPSQVAPAKANFANLTLEIGSNKKNFSLLEPLPIFVRLSNNTRFAIMGHSTISFSRGPIIELFVSHNGKRQAINNLSSMRLCGPIESRLIQPNEHYESKEMLTMDLDTLFTEPGEYQIEALLHDADGKEEIKSNQLSIQILIPTNKDLAAMNYINQQADKAFFFTPLNVSGKLSVMEEFIKQFNGTVYWDYAALTVGQFYFNQDNEEAYTKAINLLEPVSNNASFAFADQSLSYIVQIKAKMGKPQEAKRYLNRLKSFYPNSKYILSAESSIFEPR